MSRTIVWFTGITACLATSPIALHGQSPPSPAFVFHAPRDPKAPVAPELMHGITLDSTQQHAIRAIELRYVVRYDSINKESGTLYSRFVDRMAVRADERAEKRKVLSADQQRRFDKNIALIKASDEYTLDLLKKNPDPH